MNPNTMFLLLIGFTICLFGAIIYFGLKWRTESAKKWLAETDAKWVFDSDSTLSNNVTSLLYGVFQDFSNTSVGMDVRDLNDNLVGRIAYNMGDVIIEVGTEKYSCFNEGKWNLHVTLRPLTGMGKLAPPIAECHKPSLFRFTFKYFASPYSEVELKYRMFGGVSVLVDGKVIGKRLDLGKDVTRGRALVLTVDMPLVLQMLLLAGPGNTRGMQL